MATNPETLIYQLAAALRRGSRGETVDLIRAINRAQPPLGARWKSMAAVARQNGEIDDALAAMQHYVAAAGRTGLAYYELAAMNAQLGRPEAAAGLMQRVPDNIPSPAEHHYIHGTLAANLGRFSDALDHLRQTVTANPGSGQAWLALAMIGRLSAEDERALHAAAAAVERAPSIERAAYAYARGKAFDDAQEHDAAFAAITQGAAIMQHERPYDHAADTADAERACAGWQEHFARALDPVDPQQPAEPPIADLPIFVTGLPRSGTTLVEQILVSHSRVSGGGEMGIMQIASRDAGKTAADYQQYLARGNSCGELARLYQHLARQRFPGTGRIVDKSLDSSRHMGLITAIFPAAPIIWLRRDPLDCAWSAYRTWFQRGLDWSWSMPDIARHFQLEDRIMQFWADVNPRILKVNYADLVGDPENWIKRISSHCGLAMETAQLEPHKTVRNVTTASVAQVRQKISSQAVGSAKPYRQHLQPFMDVYRPAADQ